MSFTSLECYAMDKLQCGIADLSMLDNIYSTLGESVFQPEDLVNEAEDLNSLLSIAYDQISEAVKDKLYEIADDEEHLDLVIDGNVVDYDITEEQAEKIKELADELTEDYAYANCLDTHFQNDLDQTVDWEMDVKGNAEELIEYWIEKGELELETPYDIVAYVLSEDGLDYDYERYYVLRGKKVFKDDECICDMSDEEDLDLNFISERICEEVAPDFVKSIEMDKADGSTEVIFENPEDFERDEDDEEDEEDEEE